MVSLACAILLFGRFFQVKRSFLPSVLCCTCSCNMLCCNLNISVPLDVQEVRFAAHVCTSHPSRIPATTPFDPDRFHLSVAERARTRRSVLLNWDRRHRSHTRPFNCFCWRPSLLSFSCCATVTLSILQDWCLSVLSVLRLHSFKEAIQCHPAKPVASTTSSEVHE